MNRFYKSLKATLSIFILSLFILGLTTIHSLAVVSNPTLNVKLYKYIQNPSDKSFVMEAEIESTISSNRVSIEWDLPEGLTTDDELLNNDLTIEPGTQKLTIKINPEYQLHDRIKFTIVIYEGEKRYQATQASDIEIDENLYVIPTSQNYASLRMAKNLSKASGIIWIFSLAVLGIIFVIRKLSSRTPRTTIFSKTSNDSEILREVAKSRQLNR